MRIDSNRSSLKPRKALLIRFIHKIKSNFRQEGPTPFRPSMPCLVKYKSEVRKEFFGSEGGVVGV